MRILSRFLARLSRSNEVLPGVLGGCLAAGIVLSSAVAAAQPAPPPPPPGPARPPPARPAPPRPKADAPPDQGQPAPGPAAPPGAAAAPAPPAAPPAAPAAPPGAPPAAEEPLMPKPEPLPPAVAAAPPPASPDPERDAKALAKQGAERPTGGGEIGAKPSDVFAEDWWTTARPVFDIHGYYRVRAELFHNFALGRKDDVPILWPQPADNEYQGATATGAVGMRHAVTFCGSNPLMPQACTNNTQAGANMRFRLNPEIHISDNLRVMAQIDMLDNLVLGSTPEGYANQPAGTSAGYAPVARGGYAPLGAFSTTQWAPVAGVNSTQNSVTVKRVWGEYTTPIGLLRFGRMPSHWGLGMVANSGDGHDSDWQSTADRIMFVTGIKKYDLYFAGMWDFANEGLSSANLSQQQGQPHDLVQLDDVNQWGLVAVRRRAPELQRLDLAKGLPVFNGGVYFIYRNQVLANDGSQGTYTAKLGQSPDNYRQGLTRRGAQAYIPDIWIQFLFRKFRFEAEAAMIYGSIDNTLNTPDAKGNYVNPAGSKANPDPGWKIRQFGVTTQSEFRAIEDRLRIQFGFGWASGDPDVDTLSPAPQGLTAQKTADRNYSEFAFHPDYRIDLILFRNILSRVQGAYYFRPSVEYDFARDKNGQRLGGGAAVIWSRASEFIQAPGHVRDLGIELNGKIYFQSKDGTLNDDHEKMGGFFTSLEYGVLFPLGGLGYLPNQQTNFMTPAAGGETLGTATAQTLRWYLGVLF